MILYHICGLYDAIQNGHQDLTTSECFVSRGVVYHLLQNTPWVRFLWHVRNKPRLCSANHRPGYWSNLPCDWPSTAWVYSEGETENGSLGCSSHWCPYFLHKIPAPVLSLRLSKALANARRRYTCNVFSHWPRSCSATHDDVIEWKHFPRHWPFVEKIHQWLADLPH